MKMIKQLIWLFLPLVLLYACIPEDSDDLLDDRDQFLGSWNVTESCSKDAYTVTIIKDPSNSSQVLIQNFWNTGSCSNYPYAIVAGSSIFVPTQSICSNNFEVNGDGSLKKEVISWEYTVNDGADLFTCNASFTKP